jgi:hypothetical protein
MARKLGRRLAAAGLMAASASLAAGGAAHAATGDIFTVAGSAATTFSGDGGPATSAGMVLPSQVAPMPDGGFVVAVEGDNPFAASARVAASRRSPAPACPGSPATAARAMRRSSTARAASPRWPTAAC